MPEIKKGSTITLPLCFDTHVHARDMEQSHKMTVIQTFIEAKGSGVGTVCLMPNTTPSIDTQVVLDEYLKLVEAAEKETGVIGYVWVALTDTNHAEVIEMLQNEKVIGIKIYPLKDDGTSVTTGAVGIQKWESLDKIFDMMRDKWINKPIAGHWEDPLLGHSVESEVSALTKLVELARKNCDFRFVACHLTSKAGLEIISSAQKEGLQIMIELTPHHLWFSSNEVDINKGRYKCFPPIKSSEDREALRDFLKTNTKNPLVCIGSDTAPHTVGEKLSEKVPGGLASMQHIVKVMLTLAIEQSLDIEDIAAYISYNAADFLGIPRETRTSKWQLSSGTDTTLYNEGKVLNPFLGEMFLGRILNESDISDNKVKYPIKSKFVLSPIYCASGAMGNFGNGYWYSKFLKMLGILNIDGIIFVSKTATNEARKGNTPFVYDEKEFAPSELWPKSIKVNFLSDAVLNAVGLGNPGLEAFIKTGNWQKRRDSYVISWMSLGDDKVAEAKTAADIFLKYKESLGNFAIEVNISCPNTGHDQCSLTFETEAIIAEIARVGVPIFVKVSIAAAPIKFMIELDKNPLIDAITCSNTVAYGWQPSEKFYGNMKIYWDLVFGEISPLEKKFGSNGKGGLSGASIKPFVLKFIKELRKQGFTKTIIGGGGIMSPEDVILYKEAGANAVFIGSVFMLKPWRIKSIIKKAHEVFK